MVSKILPVCYKKHSYQSYVFLVFFLLSSILMSTDLLTSSDKREIWTCTQPSYGPEPNLDMYAVSATIQLSLAKNEAERIYSCSLLKSDVRSLRCQHPFYFDLFSLPFLDPNFNSSRPQP